METARDAETTFALPLIDATKARGFAVKTPIMDKGYDNEPIHTGCMDRGVVPVTALRKTPAVVRGDHKPPSCEHDRACEGEGAGPCHLPHTSTLANPWQRYGARSGGG